MVFADFLGFLFAPPSSVLLAVSYTVVRLASIRSALAIAQALHRTFAHSTRVPAHRLIVASHMAVGTSTDLRPVQWVKTFIPIPVVAAQLSIMRRNAVRMYIALEGCLRLQIY